MEKHFPTELKCRSTFSKKRCSRSAAVLQKFFNFLPRRKIERMHSTDKQGHISAGEHCWKLNLGVNNQRKRRNLFLVLVKFASVQRIEESPSECIEIFCMERGWPVLFLKESVSRPIHGDDVLLRKAVKACVLTIRDKKSLTAGTYLPRFARRKSTNSGLTIILPFSVERV